MKGEVKKRPGKIPAPLFRPNCVMKTTFLECNKLGPLLDYIESSLIGNYQDLRIRTMKTLLKDCFLS